MKPYDLIYFMGDSFTVATGQADDINNEVTADNRFSALISKHYNIPYLNNASAGCSNYHIFNSVYQDIYKLMSDNKKVLAIISYTSPTRQDLWDNKRNMPTVISETFSFYKDFVIESFNAEYCDKLSITHILAIRTLFDKFNIDYVDAFTTGHGLEIPFYDNSKCLDKSFHEILASGERFNSNGHANVKGNLKIANAFIKKIDSLYGTN